MKLSVVKLCLFLLVHIALIIVFVVSLRNNWLQGSLFYKLCFGFSEMIWIISLSSNIKNQRK